MIYPAKEIASFILRQPETIQPNLWLDVLSGFKNEMLKPTSNLERLGMEVLQELDDDAAFQRCIHVIGSLDFSLAKDFVQVEEFHKKFAEVRGDDPSVVSVALGAPLRRRQFERAANEWTKLRETRLSARSLHEFRNLQMSDRIRARNRQG